MQITSRSLLERIIEMFFRSSTYRFITQDNLAGRTRNIQSTASKNVPPYLGERVNQELESVSNSILTGEKLAEVARKLTEQGIVYQQIHYKSIEETLVSTTLDCSSFVRRAIYEATRIDIGNIKSDRFATSDKFEAFTQRCKALPGDIVHIRGHVAICQDKECSTVAEAADNKVGLVFRSTAKSAIGLSKSRIIYYRLK